MKEFEEIKTEEDYFKKIYAIPAKNESGEDKKALPNDDVVKKLCDIALETRRFEIELYWKRTTYYWAFIAAGLAAYGLVYTKKCLTTETYLIMMLLALCGLVFSVGWFLANKGSKYWQENWEAHMGLLVTKHYGPIFKYLHCPPYKGLLQGKPYSVSKINQVISGFMIIIWSMLFAYPGYKILYPGKTIMIDWKWIVIIVIFAIGMILIFLYKTKSSHYVRYRKWKRARNKKFIRICILKCRIKLYLRKLFSKSKQHVLFYK